MNLNSPYLLSDHKKITKFNWLDRNKRQSITSQIGQKLLIIYSPCVSRLGWLQGWLDVLSARKIKPTLYSLTNEPTWDDLVRCTELLVPNSRIWGIGGGSVMDLAKLSTVPLRECSKKMDFLRPKKLNQQHRLWLFPTHYSSSAYVSSSATVIRGNCKISGLGLKAEKIFIDPQVLNSIPQEPWINGAIDTVSHFVEILCSTSPLNALRFMALEGWWKDFMNALNSKDFESLFSLSIYLYGDLFPLHSVSWPIHHLAHDLGPKLGFNHGRILKLLLPLFLEARLQNSNLQPCHHLLQEVSNWIGVISDFRISEKDYDSVWDSHLWEEHSWYDSSEIEEISYKEYVQNALNRLLKEVGC